MSTSSLLILAVGYVFLALGQILDNSEVFNSYDKDVIPEETVFQTTAVSVAHCADLCRQLQVCQAFTFQWGVCTGHRSVLMTSDAALRSAARTRVFVKEGPCSNYTVLDDKRRDVNNGLDRLCDSGLTAGWHRFLIDGHNAMMPTYCISKRHCGTSAPYWLDLQGSQLPAFGMEVEARACGTWKNCCSGQRPLTVRNCGAFYLFKLNPILYCNEAYCAERVDPV